MSLTPEEELELFNQWNKTGKKEHFQQLYRSYRPVLESAMQKSTYGSTIPKSVFQLEAANEFHRSLKNFNPDKAKMKTYIYGNVQNKLKRLNSKYKDLSRIPERSSGGYFDVGRLRNTEEILKDNLGREPSTAELADGMGLSVRDTQRLQQEAGVKNLSLNETLQDTATVDSTYDPALEAAYYDMNGEEQMVFDRITGLHGKNAILKDTGTVDYGHLSLMTGLSPRRITEIRKRIARHISKAENY
ncbi:MAG: hypothetical protein DRI46_12870 [Chloroflexi bacterium]|nr:MAG: hypothetical protein DRI46_12870 [Chloroflexota bacterium]